MVVLTLVHSDKGFVYMNATVPLIKKGLLQQVVVYWNCIQRMGSGDGSNYGK